MLATSRGTTPKGAGQGLTLSSLQLQYRVACEQQREAMVRNETLLQDLRKLQHQASQTDGHASHLSTLKHQYEEYMATVYPEWVTQMQAYQSTKLREGESQTSKSTTVASPQEKPPVQAPVRVADEGDSTASSEHLFLPGSHSSELALTPTCLHKDLEPLVSTQAGKNVHPPSISADEQTLLTPVTQVASASTAVSVSHLPPLTTPAITAPLSSRPLAVPDFHTSVARTSLLGASREVDISGMPQSLAAYSEQALVTSTLKVGATSQPGQPLKFVPPPTTGIGMLQPGPLTLASGGKVRREQDSPPAPSSLKAPTSNLKPSRIPVPTFKKYQKPPLKATGLKPPLAKSGTAWKGDLVTDVSLPQDQQTMRPAAIHVATEERRSQEGMLAARDSGVLFALPPTQGPGVNNTTSMERQDDQLTNQGGAAQGSIPHSKPVVSELEPSAPEIPPEAANVELPETSKAIISSGPVQILDDISLSSITSSMHTSEMDIGSPQEEYREAPPISPPSSPPDSNPVLAKGPTVQPVPDTETPSPDLGIPESSVEQLELERKELAERGKTDEHITHLAEKPENHNVSQPKEEASISEPILPESSHNPLPGSTGNPEPAAEERETDKHTAQVLETAENHVASRSEDDNSTSEPILAASSPPPPPLGLTGDALGDQPDSESPDFPANNVSPDILEQHPSQSPSSITSEKDPSAAKAALPLSETLAYQQLVAQSLQQTSEGPMSSPSSLSLLSGGSALEEVEREVWGVTMGSGKGGGRGRGEGEDEKVVESGKGKDVGEFPLSGKSDSFPHKYPLPLATSGEGGEGGSSESSLSPLSPAYIPTAMEQRSQPSQGLRASALRRKLGFWDDSDSEKSDIQLPTLTPLHDDKEDFDFYD